MNAASEANPVRREYVGMPRRIAIASAAIACVIGAMVLIGWATGIEALTSIAPRFIPMLPIMAVAIASGGFATLLLLAKRVTAARVAAALVLAIGILNDASRVVGREVGNIGFLFRDQVALHPYRPIGVIATNSAIVLTLTGLALLAITAPHRRLRRVARGLAAISITIASVALLGHVYGARALYALDRAAGMALITAIGLVTVQVGILLSHAEEGATSLVTGSDLAGRVMRRLLPLTVGFPIIIGTLQLYLRSEELISREASVAGFVVLTIAWIIAMLLYIASYIRAAERERESLLEREQLARAAAESANRAKSDFLAVMSHELRTPLNAIVGYVQLLADGIAGPVTEAQAGYLARVRNSARHLTETVSQILKLARIEARADDVKVGTVRVAALLDEVGDMIAPLARAKELNFRIECDSDVALETDAHRVKQILINLGGNAVKFTKQGSVVLRCHANDETLQVDVADTGIGIAAEHLEKVFEPFWQVESSLTRSYEGAGLGLAVSQRIARQLGGDITVTSAPGAGSTFSFRLPRGQGWAAAAVPLTAQESG